MISAVDGDGDEWGWRCDSGAVRWEGTCGSIVMFLLLSVGGRVHGCSGRVLSVFEGACTGICYAQSSLARDVSARIVFMVVVSSRYFSLIWCPCLFACLLAFAG